MNQKITLTGEKHILLDIISEKSDASPYDHFMTHLIEAASPIRLNMINKKGDTILHIAASQRNPKLLRTAFFNGVHPDVVNKIGNTVLHEICELGDLNLAIALLHPPIEEEMHGVRPQKYKSSHKRIFTCLHHFNKAGLTPLHVAISTGNHTLTKLLLQYGADVNANTRQDHYTPLHFAAKNNDDVMVQILLKWNSNVYRKTRFGISIHDMVWPRDGLIGILLNNATAIQEATFYINHVRQYKPATVSNIRMWTGNHKSIKRHGSSQVTTPKRRRFALWRPFCHDDKLDTSKRQNMVSNRTAGKQSVVQKRMNLIAVNLLNMVNDKNDTPLHTAIKFRCCEYVRLLSLYGADPRIRNATGHNALHLICIIGDIKLLRALMDPPNQTDLKRYGNKSWGYSNKVMTSCLDIRDPMGDPPLHMAVTFNDLEIAAMLLHYGANVNDTTLTCALTPLHIAIQNNNLSMVALILEQRPNLQARTNCTLSVYDISRFANHHIKKMLVDAGAIPTPKEYSDDESETEVYPNVMRFRA